jgi:serine/threonine-protein kinase
MLKGENPRRATYRILDRYTSGAGDEVLLAEHAIFEEKVVQKTVAIHGYEDALASNEPAFLKRLKHPRITPVYEAQFDPNEDRAITFVMPMFVGGSVEGALKDDYRFSIGASIQVAIDALDALAYLHREHGAIHRDTKPGNVLLDADRTRGYLSDFGSAALTDDLGGAGAVLGTNIYRPPEARPSGRVGVDADLYGIGLMLWEMVNGRLPWETLRLEDVESRLQRGLRSVPDRMLEFEPHVPERLRRAIRKAIHRDPASRFGTAEDFIRALRRVQSIDWTHTEGRRLDGVWLGTWPPQRRLIQRTEYRVTARVLEAGGERGRIRLEADFRGPGGSWRQTAADATVGAEDVSAGAVFFETVEASAAQRDPAR